MTELIETYREQVEEQVRGNYRVGEAEALALCKKRKKTIGIRFRRGQSPRDTAAELARIEGLEPLPADWKP